MSDPLPGVERPKRPPPPKVKPQRPPPPALVSFHSTDGSTRPKLASRVNPKRHMSASAQFSRVVQGNPLFGAMKDEDDTPEDMPVAQVERITDPLGCQTWEEPVTAAVKKGGAEWVGGSIGDEKESMDLFKQTGFIEEEDRMEIPAEDHSSGLTTSASPDSISSDSSEDLFQSLNNPLFPESDFEQTENPSVDDKLHNEASLPDIELTQYTHKDGQQHDEATAPDDELTEYTRKDGKLHGGSTSPDVELKEYPGKGGKLHGGSPPPDVELTEYPGKGGKLHGGSTSPDVELTDYPGKGGKLHGRSTAPDVEQYHLDSSGTLHGDSGQKVDCNSMPLCEDYYASIPDSTCNFGESTPLEEIEEHPLHKDKTHIECNQPIMDMKPQQAIAQQPVSASAGLPADQHTSQSEAISPLEDVKSRAPAMGSAERQRVGRKVKVPLQDVFNAMQKDLKAKDPSRADKEELDEPMLSWSVMLTIALINYFYLCCGCSSFLSGFITGVYVFFLLLAGGIGFLSYYEVMKKELREKLRIEAEKEENEKLGAFNSQKLNTVTPLKSELFTVAYSYDYSLSRTPVTHPIRISLNDLRLTIEVEAASVMGSDVSRRFWQFGEDRTIQERNAIMRELDMMSCRVYLAPDEVAKDRKRRWNKKYPICLHVRTGHEQECVLYLFVKVARDKEEWYRRMRNACSGITTAELAAQQTKFYHYMSKYVPKEASQFSPSKEVGRRVTRRRSTQNMQLSQLSNREGNGEGTSVDAPISSAVKQATQTAALSSMAENGGTHVRSTKGVGGTPALPKSYQDRGVHDQAKGLLQSRQSHPVPRPDIPSLSTSRELSLDWVNVLAARLCWDFWHEEKWRKWAMQKIDKKLRRLQRPSFLEELHVTDVQLGSDVPRIKRITHQPRVDHRGVWAHMEITYKGTFTMTIETRVKSSALLQEKGISLVSGADHSPQQQSVGASFSLHHYGTASVNGEMVDADSDTDEPMAGLTGASEAEQPVVGSPRTAQRLGRLRGYVSSAWKRAANSKIARRVTEKVFSYPLVLQVEVKSLDGHLVVNIPPPPSDSIWYGFEQKPYLLLSAKPKLFNRQVTFSYVTDWIEKRLIELVEKKVVHPNMLDLTVTALNSGFPEDVSSSTTIV